MVEHTSPSKQWRRYIPYVLAGLCILGTVFGAGFFVGRWNGRASSMNPPPTARRGQHGAIGRITQISDNTLILQTREGTLQTVLLDNHTRVERGARMVKIASRDLKIGDRIIVVGIPNEHGQIRALVIRILSVPIWTPTPSGL
jgi:hypothetical protein